MSDMNFEEMISKLMSGEAKKAPADPSSSPKDEVRPEEYTTVVYLKSGEGFEHPGTIAMDLGYRIAITSSVDNLTVYNSDFVLYYEVLLTSTLEARESE